MEKSETTKNILTVSGKRKTAIAKATIRKGTGKVSVNKRLISTFSYLRRLYLEEPLRLAAGVIGEQLNAFDISVNVAGGGPEAQVEASRLAIARALVDYTKNIDLKKTYLNYDRSLLVADVRRKETRKPNDSKARAKRQKSYR